MKKSIIAKRLEAEKASNDGWIYRQEKIKCYSNALVLKAKELDLLSEPDCLLTPYDRAKKHTDQVIAAFLNEKVKETIYEV